MRIIVMMVFISSFVLCEDLKSLLDYASNNNSLIKSSKYQMLSKKSELSSANSDFLPTIDLGGFYRRDDDPTPFQPGSTYGADLKLGFDIYDGGKKLHTQKQKEDELSAAKHSMEEKRQLLYLHIVESYFNLQSLYSSLKSNQDALRAVRKQLQRVRKFYKAGLSARENVDRLKYAYENTLHQIEYIKLQIFQFKSRLELLVGKKIGKIEHSSFRKINCSTEDDLEKIKALKDTRSALINQSETIASHYYPNIRVEDSYSVYDYDEKPRLLGKTLDLLNNQNRVMLSASMRLFDFERLKKQKEALKLKANALDEQIKYKKQEQNMQVNIAKQRIKTQEFNIKSSRSALKAAKSHLKTITKKYAAGLVDNITYLDALSNKTMALAMYKKALNDLEIAYANYYYYCNKNFEELLK
jgi:outer membrane protein TolC